MSDEEYASDEQYGEEEEDGGEGVGEEGEEEGNGEEEEEEQEEEEEKEPEDPPNPITEEIVHECIGQLTRIGPGLSHAYTRIDISDRELTQIELLRTFIHLRNVNISSNLIQDLSPVASMTNLLILNAASNKISSVPLESLPYVQRITMDHNRVKTLDGLVEHAMLEFLSVEYNQIERFFISSPSKLSCLRILDLRGNKLTTAAGIYPPNLQELYLASNLITDLGNMEGLENLRLLHLRDNQIASLKSITETKLPSLTYLNLRGNLIDELQEVKHLKVLEKMSSLVLTDNPMCDLEDYRVEIWVALDVKKGLRRLDKDFLDEEELEEAKEMQEKHQQEEADALAAAVEEETQQETTTT